jgi:hypothetical protein
MSLAINKAKLGSNITKLAIICSVFGFSFPIYGFPGLAGIKLTFWRLSLLILFLAIMLMGIKIRSRLALLGLGLGYALVFFRAATYVFSGTEDRSLQQLFWFSEGILFLTAITVLASYQSWLLQYYLKTVFVVGFASIGIMALQYVLLQTGVLFSLPFSDSIFGLTDSLRPWTYPLYGGGRIIGAFYEPNMAGSMAAFYIATFIPFLLARRVYSFTRPIWIAAALAVSAIALFATGSRQALVGVGITSMLVATIAVIRGGTILRTAIFWLLMTVPLAIGGVIFVLNEQPTETPFGETQMNLLNRIMLNAGGDITGGRLQAIQQLIESMTVYTVIFGVGEGAGYFGAHNAFLIVLNQNGFFGLLLLTLFALGLFLASLRLTIAQPLSVIFFTGIASTCIVANWIGFIFMNWAQLNQSLSFMYLAIPLLLFTAAQQTRIESKSRPAKNSQRRQAPRNSIAMLPGTAPTEARSQSARPRLDLVLLGVCILAVFSLLIITSRESVLRAVSRNGSGLVLITPLSSQVIDESWDLATNRLKHTLLHDPRNYRLTQWQDWLSERRKSVKKAQSTRETQEYLSTLQELSKIDSVAAKHKLDQLVAQSKDVEAQLWRASHALAEGDALLAQEILDRMWQNAVPEILTLNSTYLDGWELAGYDLEPLSVELNGLMRLILYWQKTDGSHSLLLDLDSDTGLYLFDDKMIQVQTVRNLIANGDMEFSPMVRDHPIPYPWQLFPSFLPDPEDIVAINHNSAIGNSTLMLNAAHGELLTTFLPLRPDTPYLMVGEMKSSVPGIYMIMENVNSRNEYPSMITFPGASGWHRLAAFLTAKPSPYWPGVYIGPQTGYVGQLEIDNLGVFEIVPPGKE